ncbi:hypothetical protein EUX98_g9721 [Antrodiella citrinella]|uniref:Uncharacterized protein n=1 Tax=Antrodiella citrinella TaxID=2447956 RepID=A0A4S4LPI7_9APHY|nr:hypothetical protein EUX98_g9721 [Antrodiella citrinella]
MAADIPYNLLGLVFGVLGVAGLAPLVRTMIQHQLPQTRLKLLDATIEETSLLLETAIEEGFVPSVNFVFESRRSLRHLRGLTEGLRTNVLRASGIRKQCVAAMAGLSKRVNDVCRRAQKLRVQIVTASQLARLEAEAMQRHEMETPLDPSFADSSYTPQTHHNDLQCAQSPEESGAAKDASYTLAMPPPTFASHTSVFRQPVRLNSAFLVRCGGKETTATSWAPPMLDGSSMACAGTPDLDLPNVLIPPPYSREGSIFSVQQRSLVADSSLEGGAHIQQPSVQADDLLADRDALIAELREQIIQDLMAGIASAGTHWQNALERTLHGRSRTQSISSGDVEAGLLTLSP